MRDERCQGGHRDLLICAFLLQHIEEHGSGRPCVRVPVKIDHVVKVARPGTLAECPHFFSEGFLVGVAVDPKPVRRPVRIRMEDFAPDGRQDQPFVRGQVEFDLRPAARSGGHRASIGDPALTGGALAGIFRIDMDVEGELVGRDRQAGLLRDPGDDVLKHGPQEIFVKMAFLAQCKIKILRKPVRLEIAFFQTGAALENPAFGKLRMGVDARQQPSEDIVLFDDAWQKLERRRGVEDFTFVDHRALSFQWDGTQTRQAVTRCDPGSAGSSAA
jgi:hypothetical protein